MYVTLGATPTQCLLTQHSCIESCACGFDAGLQLFHEVNDGIRHALNPIQVLLRDGHLERAMVVQFWLAGQEFFDSRSCPVPLGRSWTQVQDVE